jgi:hypothetical protein
MSVKIVTEKRLLISLKESEKNVVFSEIFDYKKMYLEGYIVKGSPVTGGIPDTAMLAVVIDRMQGL